VSASLPALFSHKYGEQQLVTCALKKTCVRIDREAMFMGAGRVFPTVRANLAVVDRGDNGGRRYE